MRNIGRIDTYDYEKYYEDNFGRSEERLLTTKELHDLYFMCETATENGFRFILGFSPCSCSFCIHKTPENKWVISNCGERRDGYIYGIFDNIYDACIALINKSYYIKDKQNVINEFNSKLRNELSKEELEKFAIRCGYYDEYFYYDFQQTIKKMSGLPIEDITIVDERISKRKDRFFVSGTSFGALISIFINNIAESLNIDTSDLYDEWNNGKIDNETYKKLWLKRINLKNHQDLVLKELEKYNNINIEELLYQTESPLCNKLTK